MIRIFLNEPVLDVDNAPGKVSQQSLCITLSENRHEIKDGVLTIYKNPLDDASKAYKFNWDKVVYLEFE